MEITSDLIKGTATPLSQKDFDQGKILTQICKPNLQYAWDDGERPGMRYASIPVFGSTFMHHSWIGLPVQWCGLVYAYGLQELMRFDDNDLWRRQVEGMTVSAMHQQWPGDHETLAGTYPDSYGEWFTKRNPVHINPENIALNLLALRGLDPGLRFDQLLE